MKRLRAIVPSVIAASLSGCIFLVDSAPDDLSSTCRLDADGGSCATCITQYCQPELDACCGDDTCKAALPNADKCASTSDCEQLASSGDAGKTGDFVACISQSCAKYCSGLGDGGTSDSGASCPSCKSDCPVPNSAGCICEAASTTYPGNSTECSTDNVENAICCETQNYPSGPGDSCACTQIYCSDSDGICTCSIGSSVVGATNLDECFPTEGQCCLYTKTGDCVCDPNGSCDGADEVLVDQCDATTIQCPTNSARSNKTSTCTRP
ncbi:MAG: hypothetical protein ACRELY_00315 [Polyangiaceae bacterium]